MNRVMYAFFAFLLILNLQPGVTIAQEETAHRMAEFDSTLINNVGRTWTIESTGTKDGITRIVTGMDELTEARYRVMVALLCFNLSRNKDVVPNLKEIVVLNKQENQGYVFEKPGTYQTIMKTPPQKQKAAIMEVSRVYKMK